MRTNHRSARAKDGAMYVIGSLSDQLQKSKVAHLYRPQLAVSLFLQNDWLMHMFMLTYHLQARMHTLRMKFQVPSFTQQI